MQKEIICFIKQADALTAADRIIAAALGRQFHRASHASAAAHRQRPDSNSNPTYFPSRAILITSSKGACTEVAGSCKRRKKLRQNNFDQCFHLQQLLFNETGYLLFFSSYLELVEDLVALKDERATLLQRLSKSVLL